MTEISIFPPPAAARQHDPNGTLPRDPGALMRALQLATARETVDRAASHEAMLALYDLFAPRVYGLALRILRDGTLAEDVTQEVFVSLWQTAASFDPARGSATNWILCLAHRRAVERVRSAQRSRDRDTTYTAANHTAAYDSTQEAALGSIESTALRAAMSTLTADHRQILELAYFEGHTHKEISAILALPLGTAKSRIRAALHSLRTLLPTPGVSVSATA